MKKNLKLMLAIMIAAFTFASCSDVPSPYGLFAGDGGEVEGASGSGTLEDPYNVPAVLNLIKGMDAGANSDVVYVKGIVSGTVDGQNYDAGYGNGTFYISVDGNTKNQFYVYRAMYLENQSYVDGPIANVGDEVVICGKVTMHGTTPETVEKEAYLYSINGITHYDARVFGTADNPQTVAEALTVINGLENGETIGNGYVKGIVSTAPSAISAGKLTYYISDDGTATNQIQIYKGLGLNKDKFTALTDLAVGDEVVIFGPMTKYTNGNPELNDGNYLISLKKGEGGGETPVSEPKGDGTLNNPYNALGAANAVKGFTWTDKNTYQATDMVYVKGKISRIANKGTYTDGGTYGNASFYISDDGKAANEFYCYHVLYLNNTKFNEYTGEKVDIKVGDDVVIYGKLMNYQGNTPETVSSEAYLYSLNAGDSGDSGDTGGGDTPSGSNLLSNGDFESWTDSKPTDWAPSSSAGGATLSQSTDKHGGSYAVNVAKASTNKRIAHKEITLAAGEYTMTFWVKSADASAKASVRPGYVAVVDGNVSGGYQYGSYTNDIEGWQQITHTFTLTAETTACPLVMLPSTSGASVIIDDFVLVKK